MPSYTFCCQNCGDFTLILKTMTGKKDRAECPDCLEESTRVYLPPNLFSYSKELRTRFEKGMEPRRMTREELGPKQKIKNKSASRPWQVGN
ncbi:FmdB family zinc ribbon protein [Cytobacillus praedii]|uniref:Zinc ribbon domain-containing protein n=1 Tax=Cytobacillus praedii TaxID=1742358 RepID=A0A4R1AVE7_9BACI|nr:FmdB family zinc ribbon protein [Cytobacillus praedii]MED3573223.1 zinc ribbon domain-containing protein [Cytobacillus praedii]TCJ01442.1 zinc ribbon domain-containing protein [Cytobacillus praedii]